MSENKGKFTRETAQAYLAREVDMQVEKLADGIWTTSDGVYRSLFLEAENSVIAFDTFGTPGKARSYKKAIEETVPGKSISTVIYTHDHVDHAGFAADLAPGAEIIADEMCAKVIKLRESQGQLQPTRVISGEKNVLELDGIEVTLLNPGPTHGSGNVAAWFKEAGILFSSDTILANAKYGFVPDYHVQNFVRFMRGFLELEWETFVPGRYELTDRAGFTRGCDYFEAVQIETQNAFANFVPVWAFEPIKGFVQNNLAERFGDLDGFEEHVGLTAIRIVHHYLMGGWGLEDAPEPGVLLADEVKL